jgi:3-hydroxyisobutyrate dehydrogenase-like beta-hydroxyacid dehydrogenase
MRVAFLGLGIMGSAMARNLVKAGHEVRTWNRTAGKSVEGAVVFNTPRDAVSDAEVVWICVSDTAAVESVLLGEKGALEALRAGTIVVDSSTIAPVASRRFGEILKTKDVTFVDAPVTGSKIGAENGTLIFIAGGDAGVIRGLEPLFLAMGKQVIRMGDIGQGEAAKLAMNLQIALIYEGFAEAVALSRKLRVDEAALFQLIQASMVRSGVVDYKMPFVAKEDFSANFPLRLMHKDIRIALATAAESGLELPGLAAVARVYDRAHEHGRDDLDYAATLLEILGR